MYDIQAIKDKISLIDEAQRLGIDVRKPGDRCVSPLRPEATNKTSFRIEADHWYDYGSGKWGDVVDLVAELEHGGDKGAAIRELAERAGLSITQTDGWLDYTRELMARTGFYHNALEPHDREYLYRRGLTDEDIERLMIGRVTDTSLRGRLFLPYFHPNGYVCYYATRAMIGSTFPENKYMKQRVDDYCQHIPWGMQTLNRNSDTLVIAEGYFDAVSFETQGYPVLSAVTGMFSSAQLPIVLDAARRFARVFFVYDNDKISHAGERFAEKMARILLKEHIPFIVGHVPDQFKDVSEYFAADGSLPALISNAMNGITYLCNLYSNVEELSQFLRPIARKYGAYEVRNIISNLADSGRLTAAELKELAKRALTPPGELEVAEKLMQKHRLIYTDTAGFYEYTGRVWQRVTDTEVRRYANSEYGKFATSKGCANAVNLLKNLVVDNTVVFDKQPLVTFPNGTLDLETGTFREPRDSDYCTIAMDYDYNPKSVCPVWEQFIEDVTNGCGEREENLQFMAGYALMPHCKYQKIFILLGAGGNGKSVYIDVLKRVFGQNNVSMVEPSSLPQDFQRITLKDSLLNIGADVSTDFSKGEVREWLLKIAGGETIQACYKGKDYIKFSPRCKLVFACNNVPNAEVVNGLDRRLQFIEFVCSFVDYPDPSDETQKPKDVNLLDKLMIELPGIFNWVYKGYRDLNRQGEFIETPEQKRLLGEFRSISNPVLEFCEDHTFAGSMKRDDIYMWYETWCSRTGHRALSREKFLPKFRECMGKEIISDGRARVNGERGYWIKFRENS